MRYSPLLLTLALLATHGCNSTGEVLQDFDRDGSLDADDCGPDDDTIHPGAADSFGDGIDQDCDGSDGVDLDGDGYPSLLSGGTDCVDTDPQLHPADGDEDGFSTCDGDCDDADAALNLTDTDQDQFSTCTGDCDDANAQLNPNQQEVCDLLDNDCDGSQADDEVDVDLDGDPACNDCDDNNALLDALDLDGDSFSLCDGDCIDDPTQLGSEHIYPSAADLVVNGIDNNCDGIPGTDDDGDGSASEASGGGDCDDAEATTNPAASDTVGDGVDNNCDGTDGVDEDGDTVSSLASGGADCDDLVATTYPDASDSTPNGIDNNCDGIPGTDDDGDQHASLDSGGTDCNDAEATTNPAASDTVGDGIDNNCDGPDGVDADGDWHASLASGGDDCNDAAPSIFLGATDSWGNDTDEDCDACVDPDPTDAVVPGDGIDTDCDGYAYNGPGDDWDCDDSEPTIYPGAPDTVGDDTDNNCDGIDGVDGDGDLHASEASGGTDCDDTALGTYPGAPDVLDANGVDTDCDGCGTDPNPNDSLVPGDGIDADCDGYAENESGLNQDCDDENPAVYPGSTETWDSPAAGRDGNCDGDLYNRLANANTSFEGLGWETYLGDSVSSAGDVDGDGLSDLLIGMPGHMAYAGGASLWRGSSVSSGGSFEMDYDSDWISTGESGSDGSGGSVSSAGDVDGDGLDDLLIGASGNDDGGSDAGKTYLFLAASIAAGGIFDLSAADASFVGENAGDYSGSSVSSAGDVDGDGLDDLLIGASRNDDGGSDAGKTYLFLAASIAAGGTFDLSAADVSFVGENADDRSGFSVSSAGDVDGDGLSDLLIGAYRNDEGGSDAGKTYLFLAGNIAASGTFSLSAADASFVGENPGDESGSSVSSAGDVDGDGLDDLLIGAYNHNSVVDQWSGSFLWGIGKSYLFLGASIVQGLSIPGGGTFDLAIADAAFVGENPEDESGSSVSSAGDVDGDGLSDLLIGAWAWTDTAYRGKAYLLLSTYATPDYAGLWTLGANASYSCLSGAVTANLEHLNISHRPTYAALDPTLIANAYELTMDPRSPQPGLLQGGFVTSATSDSFALTRTEPLNAGACTATWALTGSYTGTGTLSADLSADLTATFTGSCGDCSNQTFPITATR